MTCRNTPAGSLATTYAKRAFGLQDSQCTSLFHELTRQYNTSSSPQISADQYANSILAMSRSITLRHDLWPDGSNLLARAQARVANALSAGYPSNIAVAFATIGMNRRAQFARNALDAVFQDTSVSTGLPLSDVTAEFNRLYNEYRNGMAYARSDIAYIPKNPATYYAIDKISQWIRCPNCGQGRYLGVNDPTHGNCLDLRDYLERINRNSFGGRSLTNDELDRAFIEEMRNNLPDFASTMPLRNSRLRGRELNIESINFNGMEFNVNPDEYNQLVDLHHSQLRAMRDSDPIPDPEEVTIPEPEIPKVPFKGSLPWDVEEFQKSYNEARLRINQQNYFLPANLELEAIPGAITGGLGAENGGNSFGIEIEIDFPDDQYPYTSRYELAKRLHAEGIARHPQVAGWHFVGPGRDGGNFTFGANDWICEFDRTVDNVEGERGVEIKSQIMFDEPDTWKNLRRVCEIATELGGKPTQRTGLHVNVGGLKFPKDNPAVHNSLLNLVATYDDTILRLAHNPLSGPTHRGRQYCQPVQVPPDGFRNVHQAKAYANHYQAFNLNHLPEEGERHKRSSRVEVRVWDSTLDPVRIQTAITLSLALVQGGIDQIPPGGETELAGAHHSKQGGRRLSGEAWESSTESFRRLVSLMSDLGAKTQWHKESLTTMFASSKWQSGENYYSNDRDENRDYDDDDDDDRDDDD